MKNIILAPILFLIFSCNLKAQTDLKYLAGAVPEVNGKVIFSDTLQLSGKNTTQIYENVLMWARANYNTEESRIVYTDQTKAVISCRGKSELIFSSSALSLDRAFMNYQLNLFCRDNACRIEMKSITYEYNVSNKQEPEKYSAEKWITDKEALNGQDKLYRSNGKFRIKTIDLFNDICNSLNLNILTGETDLYTDKNKAKLYDRKSTREAIVASPAPVIIQQPAVIKQLPPDNLSIPVEEVATATAATTVATMTSEATQILAGYKRLEPGRIPGNIIKMLSDDRMLITAGKETGFNMETTNWGGLGMLYDKPVTFCFVNPAHDTYQLMETGDTYTLSFYTEAYHDALQYCNSVSGKNTDKVKGSGLTPVTMPSGAKSFSEAWLIIECKKIIAQQLQWESIKDEKIREEWSKSQFHKLYIGEILNVWVK